MNFWEFLDRNTELIFGIVLVICVTIGVCVDTIYKSNQPIKVENVIE
jgi:hypothetical protein